MEAKTSEKPLSTKTNQNIPQKSCFDTRNRNIIDVNNELFVCERVGLENCPRLNIESGLSAVIKTTYKIFELTSIIVCGYESQVVFTNTSDKSRLISKTYARKMLQKIKQYSLII